MKITYRTYRDEMTDHRLIVNDIMNQIGRELMMRSRRHDLGLVSNPIIKTFTQLFSKLKNVPWHSDVFVDILKNDSATGYLDYTKQSTYLPDPDNGGVKNMDLLQLIELVADIMSHSERQQVNVTEILDPIKDRYGIDDQLYQILLNTVTNVNESVRH